MLVPLAEIAPDFLAGGKRLADHLADAEHGRHRTAAARPRLVEVPTLTAVGPRSVQSAASLHPKNSSGCGLAAMVPDCYGRQQE